MSKHPEILWAQRSSSSTPEKNIIYFTVNLPHIVESSLTYTLTSTSISFKAFTAYAEQPSTSLTSNSSQKSIPRSGFLFHVFKRILTVIQRSKFCLTSRSLVAVLRKREAKLEYWPRLTKEKLETPIKSDFDKWVDEDEQDLPSIEDDFGLGGIPQMGMDFSKLIADLGVYKGTESDSDEDGPPHL